MVMWGGYVWVLYRVGEADTISAFRGSLEWSAQGNLEYLICADVP